MLRKTILGITAAALVAPPQALADPCGMVPPIWLGDGVPLVRVGVQRTFVFHRDGLETLVLRPGFEGSVDEFGMLIPFPSPPAIRKVPENVFGHVAAAVDPPEVVVDLRYEYMRGMCCDEAMPAAAATGRESGLKMRRDEVQVLREEAVGMYEVAVLAAGGAEALARWMEEHGFRYPTGMDAVCEDYVEAGWCFVAVKARVGSKSAADPRPGMRDVDPSLPADAGFDGHVQAMGFRFRTEELVVPMRLSAFNEGELHNVVYVLAEEGRRIADLPEEFVVRQVPGWQLYRNVTEPLPLRVLGGRREDIPEWRRAGLAAERDPEPHSGIAKELFATDLLAARGGFLAHSYEEDEKQLLAIGEELGLRGPEIEALVRSELDAARERVIDEALRDLLGMTLTVIDGDFPRAVLARQNLTFPAYAMTPAVNRPQSYDAKLGGPAPALGGTLGDIDTPAPPASGAAALALMALVATALTLSRGRRPVLARAAAVGFVAAAIGLGAPAGAQEPQIELVQEPLSELELMPPFYCGVPGPTELEITIVPTCRPQDERTALEARARGGADLAGRGRAIVALADAGDPAARALLAELADGDDSSLVRTWAAGALVELARGPEQLAAAGRRAAVLPAIATRVAERWVALVAAEPDELAAALLFCAELPALQADVLPSLLQAGPEPFVEQAFAGATVAVRQLAAGALAGLAAGGRGDVATRVIVALSFEPRAETVPWSGGPLFVPSAGWSGPQARALVGDLVAWMVWCDARELETERAQIHNTLRSVGLLSPAGVQGPGWELPPTETWLLAWGRATSRFEIERLLARQGLERVERFAAVLAALGSEPAQR